MLVPKTGAWVLTDVTKAKAVDVPTLLGDETVLKVFIKNNSWGFSLAAD